MNLQKSLIRHILHRIYWQFRSHNHIFIEPSRPFTPFLKTHNNRFFGPSLCQGKTRNIPFDISLCPNNERCMFANIPTNISSGKGFPIQKIWHPFRIECRNIVSHNWISTIERIKNDLIRSRNKRKIIPHTIK